MEESTMKNGVIVLLDLLGGKFENESDIRGFIKTRNEVKEFYSVKMGSSEFNGDDQLNCRIFTFADNLMLCAELQESNPAILRRAVLATRRALFMALNNGNAFRGAISYGKYFLDEGSGTILGPAVNDAASWHDKLECIGAILTPKTLLKFKSFEDDGIISGNSLKLIAPIKVPNKIDPNLELGFINWPSYAAYSVEDSEDPDPIKEILRVLSEIPQPFHTEEKYLNTIETARKCLKLVQKPLNS